MNRRSAFRLAICLALALAGLAGSSLPPAPVKAQSNQIQAQPVTLYRFRVSNQNLGYMLHPFTSAGQNLGYVNEGSIWPANFSGIVLPQPPGYTPAPGQHLIPIYQWRVVQGGRTYYYYSGPSFGGGSGYYYEGQLGWVLPASFQSGTTVNNKPLLTVEVHYYYSQSKGYWYAALRPGQSPLAVCYPDGGCGGPTSFVWQGVGFQIPIWDPNPLSTGTPTFTFDPPPPQPECDPDGTQEQSCYMNGGSWNPSSCSCEFDSNPCGNMRVCPEMQNQTLEEAPPPSE